ncbi:MAG: ABC transporter permease [Candidatus Margulisiibacteriota bacterium]
MRFLVSFGLLIFITAISFFLMSVAPGKPMANMLNPKLTAADLAQFQKNLGLDAPVSVRYVRWLGQLAQGNLGHSLISGQPVTQLIAERLPATLLLSGLSLAIMVTVTIPLGLWAGVRTGRLADHIITLGSFVGMSLPAFWLALMLVLILSLKWGWFPSSGMMDPMVADGTWLEIANSIAAHLVLPLITVLVGGAAGLIRYTRNGVVSVLHQPYILAARSRGLSEYRLVTRHVLKNAALPLITVLGLSLPGIFAGSFVIEYIFSWPGMGQLGVQSVFQRDYPVMMGILLITSILIILGNWMADLAYRWADPRVENL